MKWVYILKCSNDVYYIGETKRLYRRFWEHIAGNGGVNTTIFEAENIIAIYSVGRICKFKEYNNKIRNNEMNIYFDRCQYILDDFNKDDEKYESLEAENYITECMMINNKDKMDKIRGGKYVRFNCEYKFPNREELKDLPLCNCGIPCDVKKTKNYLYFRCAKKNLWDDLKETFEIEEEACNYYLKYDMDVNYYVKYNEKKNKIQNLVKNSPWLYNLVGSMHEQCIGGCGKTYDDENTIRYSKKAINLCFDCFIDKNDELKKQYQKQYNKYQKYYFGKKNVDVKNV